MTTWRLVSRSLTCCACALLTAACTSGESESQDQPQTAAVQVDSATEVDLTYDCTIPERGDFQATIAGGVTRKVVRGANSTAGLDPWPMGGLVLHISNRYESDFDFGVVLGGTPETGAVFEISDGNMMPPISFSGGIDYDKDDDKAGWFLGDATVRFEKVTPAGACGTLTGEIVGMMAGTMAPRELLVTIDARFWAESRE